MSRHDYLPVSSVPDGISYQQQDVPEMNGMPPVTDAAAAAAATASSSFAAPAFSSSRRSSVSSEAPHLFSAFGLWSPVYFTGFTLSAFLLAFVLGREDDAPADSCDSGLDSYLLLVAGTVFAFMAAFMIKDVWEQRRSLRYAAIMDDDGTPLSLHLGSGGGGGEEGSVDWVAWILRLGFVLSMMLLALLGRQVLNDRHEAEYAARAALGVPVSEDPDAPQPDLTGCAAHDNDLQDVTKWMVYVEANSAALCAAGLLVKLALRGWRRWRDQEGYRDFRTSHE